MTTQTEGAAPAAIQKRVSPADALVLNIMDTLHRRDAKLELLLPKGMEVQRFKESFRLALAVQPDLMKCTPESLVLAVLRGARTGLPVDGSGGLAYIIPFNTKVKEDNKDKWVMTATYIPGYKGMVTLAKATGLVKDMQPIAVYKRDVFSYNPADDQPVQHSVYFPETDGAEDDRGPLRAVYCKTVLPDGTKRFDVMSLKDVMAIKAKSKAQWGPWTSDFDQMALKTVVKRAFRSLGVPPGDVYKALRVALAADEAADTGREDPELAALETDAKPSANTLLKRKLDVPVDDPIPVMVDGDPFPREPGSDDGEGA